MKFSGVASSESMAALHEDLADGWEPFSAVALDNGDVMLFFRRPAAGPTPTVHVEPRGGQYL
jgi:hypothetical protein